MRFVGGVVFRAEGRPCSSMSSPHVFAPCLKLLDTGALLLRAVCTLGCLALVPWHHVPGGGPEAPIWGVQLGEGHSAASPSSWDWKMPFPAS